MAAMLMLCCAVLCHAVVQMNLQVQVSIKLFGGTDRVAIYVLEGHALLTVLRGAVSCCAVLCSVMLCFAAL
jgi:hypothetical protein